MRKIFLIATLTIACFCYADAQNFLNIKMSKGAVNSGDSVNIDVTVTNFTSLIGAQFSINWDSTKFKFGKIENKISSATLPGDLDVGFPPTGNIKAGQVTFSWNYFNPISLPNDTRLFTIRMKAIGAACDSTAVVLSDKPTKAEYYNENFETFKPTSTPGQAKINGAGCNGGGGGGTGDELIVKAPTLNAKPGTEICIPITVTNFLNIEGAQSKIKWDPAVLKIKQPVPPLKYDALPNNIYNTTQIGIGELNFVWITNTGPLTIPNGDRLMEICFEVVGPEGSMTTIDLVDKDANTETEYTDSSGTPVSFINMDGKVTVSEMMPETLKLTIANVNGIANDSVDVSFTVDNFIDIKAAQFAVVYDPNILQFGRRYMDADPAGASGSLHSPGRYNYSYLANGVSTKTLANGSLFFKLRFKIVPCPANQTTPLFSAVTVNDLPMFLIEFIDKNTTKVPYTVMQGSVTASCTGGVPVTCDIISKTNVSCFGKNDATITVSVTGAEGCQCSWTKDGAAFGNAIPTPNCNLANIGPGVYTLAITCNGETKCTSSTTIIEPSAISVNGTITNVSCNTLGSIILNVSGGSGSYTYLWNTGVTAKDLNNISAGEYSVTVTDGNKCTAVKAFTVIQLPTSDLTVEPVVTNVNCFGEPTGSIKLKIAGGCTPYIIKWAHDTNNNTDNAANLVAGSYGVTVSDASIPSKSVASLITISQPASALSVIVTSTNSTGSNGTIDVSASGGTSPYTYKWSDGPTSEDRNGLAPGTYIVEVTDAKNCKTSKSIEVKSGTSDPSMGNVIVSSEAINAGYGVSCVNVCDGVISGNASGGTAPYTIVLSGQASKTITLNTAGPFSFTALCVGSYSVKLTDATGFATPEKSINITQPTAIIVTRKINCADGVLPTGSIELEVSGGAGSYTFKWSNNKTTKDIDNLQQGAYAVVVADANGCQTTLTNLRVNDCNGSDENCYQDFTNIITPNNDGINDYFLISCAENIDNDLYVYDRWGSLVFSQKNYNNLWNGVSSSGSELPEGGYMWVLTVREVNNTVSNFKGALTILRNE